MRPSLGYMKEVKTHIFALAPSQQPLLLLFRFHHLGRPSSQRRPEQTSNFNLKVPWCLLRSNVTHTHTKYQKKKKCSLGTIITAITQNVFGAPRPRLAKRRWMKNIVINPETDFSLPKKPIFKSCQLRFLVATIFSNVSIGISMEMDFFSLIYACAVMWSMHRQTLHSLKSIIIWLHSRKIWKIRIRKTKQTVNSSYNLSLRNDVESIN